MDKKENEIYIFNMEEYIENHLYTGIEDYKKKQKKGTCIEVPIRENVSIEMLIEDVEFIIKKIKKTIKWWRGKKSSYHFRRLISDRNKQINLLQKLIDDKMTNGCFNINDKKDNLITRSKEEEKKEEEKEDKKKEKKKEYDNDKEYDYNNDELCTPENRCPVPSYCKTDKYNPIEGKGKFTNDTERELKFQEMVESYQKDLDAIKKKEEIQKINYLTSLLNKNKKSPLRVLYLNTLKRIEKKKKINYLFDFKKGQLRTEQSPYKNI